MDKGIFSYVLRYSKREQLFLMLMAALSFPFYFVSLDIPKQILNIVFRREIFDLRADLSDQIDDQKIKSIDLDHPQNSVFEQLKTYLT